MESIMSVYPSPRRILPNSTNWYVTTNSLRVLYIVTISTRYDSSIDTDKDCQVLCYSSC